jgi:ribosomal protein S12 methylthiotransferase accessory factor
LTLHRRDASVNDQPRSGFDMNVRGETQSQAEVLAAAAAILSGDSVAEGPAFDLLVRLDYLDGMQSAVPHRAALLRAATRFQRIFTLRAEDAPGLVALGAEVDAGCLGVADAPTAGVSGTGLSFRQAFESCVGEGVEYIAQFLTPDDRLVSLTADDALADARPALRGLWDRLLPCRRAPAEAVPDWAPAADLADGALVYLPADLCFRRPPLVRDIDPPWPLSTGCGAGADALDATLHGLLELIERDAVALWLRGGMRARTVPPGPGAALLGRLRGGVTNRHTWLVDITSDIGVPVVVAASCNENGFGLCRGFACRATLAAAADAALMELAQMELAYRLSATKRALRGETALNDTDRQHIDRYTAIDVRQAASLHPLAPPAPPCDVPSDDRIAVLSDVRKRLEAVGAEGYAANLTRSQLAIAVTRTIAPGLEMSLAAPPGPRLLAAAERNGVDPARPFVL